ncbi:redoxin domain-containing protein [Urechidicola croceus]|uniref:Thioredoxin domain-containing protein n=1 Tax=Urechidicola croceus TaxID=1850246 RepID=A0A1D8P681_9FLAO|nr:redoxin domain-containing protein [Urechidicola croceus]AOW20078.1 hypothetical protein LPB138_05015 [Urechidicola croceus]
MKFYTTLIFILLFHVSFAQTEFENINIETLNGIEVPLTSVLKQQKDKPLILFTWAKKWCVPCVEVLNEFDYTHYEDLKEEFGLKLIALNMDVETEIDEIKKYVISKEWYFDVYQDPSRNYLDALGISTAPQIFLIINNKIVNYKSGFIKMSDPETTSDYMKAMIESIGSKKVFFDDNWDYTDEYNATYIRYVDYLDNHYEVQDRWETGELQMKGIYSDKYLSQKDGVFTWYFKSGNKKSREIYENNIQNGNRKVWYEEGQLWVVEEHKDGKLINILELYDINGDTLNHGNLVDGNGYIYRYDRDGKKTSKQNYKNGVLDGEYIQYDANENPSDTYIYSEGSYIKKIE